MVDVRRDGSVSKWILEQYELGILIELIGLGMESAGRIFWTLQ
jgi:hypothetical protein